MRKRLSQYVSILITFILLVSTVSYSAETAQKGLVYVISDFSKGLNTKLSAFNLPPEQATIAENLRFNKSLKAISRRDSLNVYGNVGQFDPVTSLFRHYMRNGTKVLLATYKDEIVKGNDNAGTFTDILTVASGSHHFQWVTWHNIAIGTDGFNPPVKYDGTSNSATYLGSALAILHGSGSGPASGNYTYKVAFYTTTYTVLYNVPSNTITANGNDVDLSMIPIGPTTYGGEAVIGRKVYRTTSNTSTYKLLSNGTIADNFTLTLTDSDADAALGAAMPAGNATWTPPTGKFVLVQNNRLFFANDPNNSPSRVWYGEDGSNDNFINTSYLDIRQNDGDAITFIKGNLGILTVGKNNTIQKIYIDGVDPVSSWSISDPFSYIGCQAPYSAVNTPTGIFYLAKDGIYRFNGQYSELISESVTPVISDIAPNSLENVWGVYHNNNYHMAYTSESSGEHFNNRVLVLDLLAKAYETDLLNIGVFTVFNSGNDSGVLFAGASDSGQVYAYAAQVNEIIHRKISDFLGLFDNMRVIPIEAGGDEDSPVIELSRTETINELIGTINSLTGTIDRQDHNGHYVSQPINISARAFQSLFWNQTLPPGGTVSFQLRTSPTGEENLLYNDSFEFWDDYPDAATPITIRPNKWTLTAGSGGAATADSVTTHVGLLSAKLTKPSAGQTIIAQSLRNSSAFRGETMTFDGWMKSANSTAGAVYFQVTDGATVRKFNYGNSGNWQEAATSLTISATANTITVSSVIDTSANAVAYFDQVMLVDGAANHNDWSAWSTPAVSNSVGADISDVTPNVFFQYLINMFTPDLTKTPNIINQQNFNIKVTYDKEGAAQSTNVPIRYVTGWLDFGQPNMRKILRSLESYHLGTTGTLSIKIENYEGDSQTYNIDLSAKPTRYKEFMQTGAFPGKLFKITITSSGVAPVQLSKIIIVHDLEPSIGTL